MATYSSPDLNSKNVSGIGGAAVVLDGKVTLTAAAQTGDIIQLLRVPAGTRLCEISLRVSTAFSSSTCPCTLRLTPVDGSTATELVAAGDTVLATINKKSMVFNPVTTTKDTFLECLLGTVAATAAAGVVSATALGMALGAA